jgi:hypothetical protein
MVLPAYQFRTGMMQEEPPLHFQLFSLRLKAVLIQCLNRDQVPVATASGFLVQERAGLYLYTCWHVVTGLKDPERPQLPPYGWPNRRMELKVTMQDATVRQPGVEVIGGSESFMVPLYDTSVDPPQPLWIQDSQDIPHTELNAANIRVPFWHDAVKLRLPSSVRPNNSQIVEPSISTEGPLIGDKVFVVGYPYGYSADGPDQPTPVVLTRFIAATPLTRKVAVILESGGRESMSGGPVFLQKDSKIFFLGLYVGVDKPAAAAKEFDSSIMLGRCCNMMIWFTPGPEPQSPAP